MQTAKVGSRHFNGIKFFKRLNQKILALIYHAKIQRLLHFLVSFLTDAPFHGLRHLARRDITFWEFLFWICSILGMIAIAIMCCINLLQDFSTLDPILVLEKNYLLFETSLPAYTFCPHKFIDERKAIQFMENKSIPLYEQSKILTMLEKLEKRSILSVEILNDYDFAPWLNSTNYLELIFNFSMEPEIKTSTGQVGVRVFTELGICYTFNNMLNDTIQTNNWVDENQNFSKAPYYVEKITYRDEYPLDVTFEFPTSSRLYDFYIHSPYELPTFWTRRAATLNASKSLKWIFSIKSAEISNESHDSKCRELYNSPVDMFSQSYAHSLCLIECRTHYAIELCGCIPHFYAVKAIIQQFPTTTICSSLGLNCLISYGPALAKLDGVSKFSFPCKCLPNCKGLIVEFKLKKLFANEEHNILRSLISQAPNKFFRRSQMYFLIDVTASIGNFFSVFFGFNLLSVFQVIYFFTLRFFWFRRGYRQ